VLFLPVLLFDVFRLLGLRFAVLLEALLAVLPFVVLLEPLLAVVRLPELLFAVLFLPVLLFAVVFLPELLFLLELLFAVLFLPVLLLLPPARFFAPLRFRVERAPRPSDSASMSSSFRIREAPLIPARVARLRSSTTVMSSMLRATSAPSPIFPLTCAGATPVRGPLITRPAVTRLTRMPSRSTTIGASPRLHREGCAVAPRALEGPRRGPGGVCPSFTRERKVRGRSSTGSRRAGRQQAGRDVRTTSPSARGC
jgi:hypothetical protein